MPRSSRLDVSPLREALLKLLADDADAYPALIEQQFPHVLQRLLALWGKPELDRYFQGLLLPAQPGGKGFPEAVLVEILSLKALCHARGMLAAQPQLQPAPAGGGAGAGETHDEAAAILERFQRR